MLRVESFSPASPAFDDFRAFADELYSGDPLWSHPADPLAEFEPTCYVVYDSARIVGRACTTRRPTVSDSAELEMGCGWYECIDDSEASSTLLKHIIADVRTSGSTAMIGPINGSTWYRYRFAEPTPTPPFFLDVYNKPWYARQWRDAGMSECARYTSTSFDLTDAAGHNETPDKKYDERGITLRQYRPDRAHDELRTLYTLSVDGFRDNYLYSPIAEEVFLGMYEPIIPLVRPEFVLIAENADSVPIGFVFVIDNLIERTKRSLVVKSLAVIPEYRGIGLGHRLLATAHYTARQHGYDEIIHALMIEANRSAAVFADRSVLIRNYSLFDIRL